MNWIWILGAVLSCIFGFLGFHYVRSEMDRGWGFVWSIIGALILIVWTLPGVIGGVDPGRVYTQTYFGRVSDQTLPPGGPYLLNPLTYYDGWTVRPFNIDVANTGDSDEAKRDSLLVFTSDAAPITVHSVFQGQFNPRYVVFLRRNGRTEENVINQVIRPAMRSAQRLAVKDQSLTQVLGAGRAQLASAMGTYCQSEVNRLFVGYVGLSNQQATEIFRCLPVAVGRIDVPNRISVALTEQAAAAPEANARQVQGQGIGNMVAASHLSPNELATVQNSNSNQTRAQATRENHPGQVVVNGSNTPVTVAAPQSQ